MNDQDWGVPIPPKLPGEAPRGRVDTRTGSGIPANPSHAVFPIVRFNAEGKIDLLGTGFYISTNGLFVTARHVLSAPFGSGGLQRYPIAMIHFYPGNNYLVRPILRCASHPIGDVAVGVAAPMQRKSDGTPLTNPILSLTIVPPEVHTHVFTYAYPRYANVSREGSQILHWMPTFYDGVITEYLPTGRDRVLLPGPCYRTNIAIHHGASGGPVFSRDGGVFAVNSTGFDGTEDSYVSQIDEIFDLTIDDVAIGNQPSRSVPVSEIARSGHIVVRPPFLG